MRTQTAVLFACACAVGSARASAQQSQPAAASLASLPGLVTIGGVVTDTAGLPLDGVTISLDPIAGELERRTRSTADGGFMLADVAPGLRSFQLRRLGYSPVTLAVQLGPAAATPVLEFVMVAAPVDLEPVKITEDAPEPGIRLQDFDRLRRQNRFGYFFDREEIERRGQTTTSELLRRVPGVLLQASGGIGNTVRMRGCRPMVWLDGVSLPGAEVDEVTRSADIAGMAVYVSWGSIPARYMDRRAGNCGAVLIWTR